MQRLFEFFFQTGKVIHRDGRYYRVFINIGNNIVIKMKCACRCGCLSIGYLSLLTNNRGYKALSRCPTCDWITCWGDVPDHMLTNRAVYKYERLEMLNATDVPLLAVFSQLGSST